MRNSSSPAPLTRSANARLTCALHDSQPQAALGCFFAALLPCPVCSPLTRQNRQGTGLKFKIPATVQFKTVKLKLSDSGRNGPRRAGPSGRLIKPVWTGNDS